MWLMEWIGLVLDQRNLTLHRIILQVSPAFSCVGQLGSAAQLMASGVDLSLGRKIIP
jgi:hypothetical protein